MRKKINKAIFKKLRKLQFGKTIDDQHAFIFIFYKVQTRYRQKNYVRTSYKVNMEIQKIRYGIEQLSIKYNKLADIGFECTLKDYFSKDQRKLMSKELRDQIKKRDNYTCQICGKHMPDEVGLQIDHIIPVAKGGKTIPSNLQVLCSKCNGRKSSKI